MTTAAAVQSDALSALGIADTNYGGFAGEWIGSGTDLEVITPIDGQRIATVNDIRGQVRYALANVAGEQEDDARPGGEEASRGEEARIGSE